MKKILFFGELPPNIHHGISLSNQRIINFLSGSFAIKKITDNSYRKRWGGKTLLFFYYLIKIVINSFSYSDFFYTNLPASRLGLIKLYLIVFFVTIFNPKIRIVLHLHRGDFINLISGGFEFKIFCKIYIIIDKLVVLSNKTKNELILKDTLIEEKKDKIEVLYNTIMLFKKNHIGDGGEGNICCVCNYIRTKRLDSLVVIANRNLFKTKFYGSIFDECFHKEMIKLDKNNICNFNKSITGDEKFKIFRSSRCLVLPSLNEGMPLTILEALSQGTPVICFNIGDISEYLGGDYPGIVNQLDDLALENKIQWLNNLNDEEYFSLRQRSFDLFWNNYSEKMVNSKLKEIFY